MVGGDVELGPLLEDGDVGHRGARVAGALALAGAAALCGRVHRDEHRAGARRVGRRDADGTPGDGISRRYLEANVAFYLTAGLTILFMHNWFSLLAHGADNLEGNDPAWIIWAVVDTTLPIALGVTGCRMWCDASPSKSNS